MLFYYFAADLPGRCYTAIESGMCASPLGDLVRRTMCCCVVHGQETLGKCFAAIGHGPERCATIGTRKSKRNREILRIFVRLLSFIFIRI